MNEPLSRKQIRRQETITNAVVVLTIGALLLVGGYWQVLSGIEILETSSTADIAFNIEMHDRSMLTGGAMVLVGIQIFRLLRFLGENDG